MVRFERIYPEGWYGDHGVVYSVSDGTEVMAHLYWAWLGPDGAWIHLDAEPGCNPLWAAAAIRLGIRRVLPAGLLVAQTEDGGRMDRILEALGWAKVFSYFDEKNWNVRLHFRKFGTN